MPTMTARKRKPRRWFLRTVRDGQVTIAGVTYRPDSIHLPYDGRLDGLRSVFARYLGPGEVIQPFIALWGTEKQYRDGKGDDPGPEVVDGRLPWYFWREATGQPAVG